MVSSEYTKVYTALMARMSKGEATVDELRKGFEGMMTVCPKASDISMESSFLGKIPVVWIHAPNASKERIILFFHGGGYVSGSTASHQDFLGRLSRASSCDIVGIDYRLAPEYPYPAALEDAVMAYEELLISGFSPSQIIVAGASAGGGLALCLLYALKERGDKMPSCALGLCPWLDLSMSEPSISRNMGKDVLGEKRLRQSVLWYAKERDLLTPTISPLFGDPTGFPPVFLMTGSLELLFDEVLHFSKKLQSASVPVHLDIGEGMFHTWFLFASKFPEGQQAIERMARFLWNV